MSSAPTTHLEGISHYTDGKVPDDTRFSTGDGDDQSGDYSQPTTVLEELAKAKDVKNENKSLCERLSEEDAQIDLGISEWFDKHKAKFMIGGAVYAGWKILRRKKSN